MCEPPEERTGSLVNCVYPELSENGKNPSFAEAFLKFSQNLINPNQVLASCVLYIAHCTVLASRHIVLYLHHGRKGRVPLSWS